MNRPALIRAACYTLEAAGEAVSRRSVQAFLRRAFDKGFSTDEIAPFVKAYKERSGPFAVQDGSAPGPSGVLKTADSGPSEDHRESVPAIVPADHNGLSLKSTPETTSPSPTAKRTRIPTPAVTFELADEGRVRRLIATAASQNTTGMIAESRVLTMRAELRALLDEHGLELWRRGVDAAADKGSVAYAKAVMKNNRPPPGSLFSNVHFANEGNADDAIAAARAKATRRS